MEAVSRLTGAHRWAAFIIACQPASGDFPDTLVNIDLGAALIAAAGATHPRLIFKRNDVERRNAERPCRPQLA